MAAESMTHVAKCLSTRVAEIAEGFVDLCSDTEAEVRSASAECMATVAS